MSGYWNTHSLVINVFDLETYKEKDGKIIPFCACFILENREYSFYYGEKNVILASLNTIVTECNSSYIELFVHNLNFDGMLILETITKEKIKFDVLIQRTNIYYIQINYLNKTIKFRCSYKLIPLSLKKLGEIENFKKLWFPYKFISIQTIFYKDVIPNKEFWETEEDYDNFLNSNENILFDVKQETIKYCMNDVILTKKVLENVLQIIKLEDKKIVESSYSSASLSYKIFFKKYNVMKINEKIKKSEENFIRQSYFGGRCEVFGNLNKDEKVKYFDFSGMYAQCMEEKFHNGNGFYLINSDTALTGFHTIEYSSNFEFLPVLPSHSDKNKLIFANGERKTGTFWFEEIEFFKKKGGKVHKTLISFVYNSYEEVFSQFITKFSEIRKKGGYYNVFGKLMINAFYGGMGLRPNQDEYFITFSEEEYLSILDKFNITMECKINSVYIIEVKKDYKYKKHFKMKKREEEFSKRNVSYSSAIAAKARIKLYKGLEEVIEDGGRLLYTDTDSIFAAYDKNDNREYFFEKKWLKFYEDAVFIAPKTYALKSVQNDVKIKGVRVQDFDFYEIKNKFYQEKDLIFTNQLNFRKINFLLKQTYIEKKISLSDYDKRIFTNNKKNTKPMG